MTAKPSYRVETENPADILNTRLDQAHALSAMLYGAGSPHEGFAALAPELRESILWALHDLIADAKVAATRINRAPLRAAA